jgi:exopolyphosphatase/guanosine-5'-triphosphate,3'-diphosphate pyrophosphatase
MKGETRNFAQSLGRLAAIDVGTNSIRLVVVEVSGDRGYRILDDEKVVVRLGRGLSQHDELDRPAMDEAATTIAQLKGIADGYGVDALRAAATWAVREAANGDEFVDLVADRAGLEVDVISADDEGRLAFLGARRMFDLSSTAVAVMDVGGGSTEIVLGTDQVIDQIYALPVGAVGLTERFAATDTISGGQYKDMRRVIRRMFERRVGKPPFVPHLLIGTGGTFTTMAAISMHRGSRDLDQAALPFTVRGYEIRRSEVMHILNLLRKMRLRDRARVAGLSPDRADIIVAGLAILAGALRYFDINRIRVADQGIRAGLVYEMIDERWPSPAADRGMTIDRMQSVRRFAAACHYEREHADHVARLAGQIHDQLAADPAVDGSAWAATGGRDLLTAAALLHDVGYLINYSKHHKHSYHLILHSDLAGFTQRELELIANIARYHRGAPPKPMHSNFARLSPDDQALVRRLAGILRLAVGLDRSHTQDIHGVRVRCAKRTAFVEAVADGNPSVDLWAGERKADLFEAAFGRRVCLSWSAETQPATPGPRDSSEETIDSHAQ